MAQRCRRNMPGQPEIAHDPVHPRMPRRSWELGLCICDLQRNIGRHGRPSLAALDASGASGLAATVVRALRGAGVDSHAPLRMLARRRPPPSQWGSLSGGTASIGAA
jgi:hypothetical protein